VTADQLAAPKGEPGTGTIHKGAIIADAPEDRKKALDLMYQLSFSVKSDSKAFRSRFFI
jgi:hypothetical protein